MRTTTTTFAHTHGPARGIPCTTRLQSGGVTTVGIGADLIIFFDDRKTALAWLARATRQLRALAPDTEGEGR